MWLSCKIVKAPIAERVTLLERPRTSERVWIVIHADTGPYLLRAWYRPPEEGEVDTINSFQDAWQRHCQTSLVTIVVGDMNVHPKKSYGSRRGVVLKGRL